MEWIFIVVAAAIVLAGVLGLVAAMAASESDRVREAARPAEAAIWAAGFSLHELHGLAEVAAAARADLEADEVEIALKLAAAPREAIVVTGSRLPPQRLGAHVEYGEGLAGRGLATGRTAVGAPTDPGGPTEVAVPITGSHGVAGVITAKLAGGRRFQPAHVARLQELAGDAGHRLGSGHLGNTA